MKFEVGEIAVSYAREQGMSPDVIQECQRAAQLCKEYVKDHEDLSDLTHKEKSLLLLCADTLEVAADYIAEIE